MLCACENGVKAGRAWGGRRRRRLEQ